MSANEIEKVIEDTKSSLTYIFQGKSSRLQSKRIRYLVALLYYSINIHISVIGSYTNPKRLRAAKYYKTVWNEALKEHNKKTTSAVCTDNLLDVPGRRKLVFPGEEENLDRDSQNLEVLDITDLDADNEESVTEDETSHESDGNSDEQGALGWLNRRDSEELFTARPAVPTNISKGSLEDEYCISSHFPKMANETPNLSADSTFTSDEEAFVGSGKRNLGSVSEENLYTDEESSNIGSKQYHAYVFHGYTYVCDQCHAHIMITSDSLSCKQVHVQPLSAKGITLLFTYLNICIYRYSNGEAFHFWQAII